MPSQVYFMDLRASAKEPNFKKFQRLMEALDLKNIIKRKKRPLVGVKLHFGEKGNTSFIRPVYVRQVVDHIYDHGGGPSSPTPTPFTSAPGPRPSATSPPPSKTASLTRWSGRR